MALEMEGKGRTGRILGDGVGICNGWAMSGQLLGTVVPTKTGATR